MDAAFAGFLHLREPATFGDRPDGYRFSPEAGADGREVPPVANPTLVLYYMQYFLQNHHPQPQLVDRNLRTDYMKIRHVITEGRKVNGNYRRLEDVIVQLDRYAKDRDLARAWNLKEQGGTVTLHRIAVVFHGGDVACCEEI